MGMNKSSISSTQISAQSKSPCNIHPYIVHLHNLVLIKNDFATSTMRKVALGPN